MTVARETQDEAAKVMRCLGESLRDPPFATAVFSLLVGFPSQSRPCSHSSHFLAGGLRDTEKATRE